MDVKRIVTHKKPDADALVAIWLAARHLFGAEEVDVVFVGRNYILPTDLPPDCVVDVGRAYDPARLVFDHKPPAFPDRNLTCAARLVWEHLLALGEPVHHLRQLIQVIHEGDRRPAGKHTPALLLSKRQGFHAYISRLRKSLNDQQLYRAARTWLDLFERTVAMN